MNYNAGYDTGEEMKQKIRVILVDEKTGKEFYNEVQEHLEYTITNDLADAPHSISIGYNPIMKYSKGHSINLMGYVKNPDEQKEFDEALKANGLE